MKLTKAISRAVCIIFGCDFPNEKSIWFPDRIESPACSRCGQKVVTPRGRKAIEGRE